MTPLFSALAALLAAFAVVAAVRGGRAPVTRLQRLTPGLPPVNGGSGVVIIAASGLLALVVGPWALVLVALGLVLRQMRSRDTTSRREVAERARLRRAGPLAYDLLSSCVAAGVSLPAAIRIVAEAVGEPLAPVLSRVAGSLERGCETVEAMQAVAEAGLDGFARVCRGADSGGPGLAAALRSLAVEERAVAAAAAAAGAKRAGVWAVGPLALCFLPAFVLVGVVPIVASVFRSALP